MPSYAVVRRDPHAADHRCMMVDIAREMNLGTCRVRRIWLNSYYAHFDLDGAKDLDESWVGEDSGLKYVVV